MSKQLYKVVTTKTSDGKKGNSFHVAKEFAELNKKEYTEKGWTISDQDYVIVLEKGKSVLKTVEDAEKFKQSDNTANKDLANEMAELKQKAAEREKELDDLRKQLEQKEKDHQAAIKAKDAELKEKSETLDKYAQEAADLANVKKSTEKKK